MNCCKAMYLTAPSPYKGVQVVYQGSGSPAIAMVADYRIEQMLALVDNAIDFHRKGTAVRVQLDHFPGTLQISVSNRGPIMSETVLKSVFDSMVSHRGPARPGCTLAWGLYVVRVIAEHHGGIAKAVNLADGSGVAMIVQLPSAETAAPHRAIRPQYYQDDNRLPNPNHYATQLVPFAASSP